MGVETLSGEVNVRGTSGVIPLAIIDGGGQQDLKQLNLELTTRTGDEYALNLQRTLTSFVIAENDIHWRGVMDVGGERLDLKLYVRKVRKEPTGLIVWIDGTEFLGGLGDTGPATDLVPNGFIVSVNDPAMTIFTDTGFAADFQNIIVPNTSPAFDGEGDHELTIKLTSSDSNLGDVVGGYRISLLDNITSLSELPASGQHTITVGRLSGGIAFRAFDEGGRMVVDSLETAYPDKTESIAELKAILEPFWAAGPSALADKRSIRRLVATITGQNFTETGLLLGDIEMTIIPGQNAHLSTTLTGRFSLKRDVPQQPDIDSELFTSQP